MTAIVGRRNRPDEERRFLLLEAENSHDDSIENALPRIGLTPVTARVSSESEFAAALRGFDPDVILSDPHLAPLPTTAALKVLQEVRSTTPLIVVAKDLDGQTAVDCLRAGAEDLVLKENMARLPSAIDTALHVRQPLKKLSPRQLEVLRMVTEGHTTKAIADHLKLSVKTVESHRGELTKRLGIREVAGLVRYAVRVGLIPLAA